MELKEVYEITQDIKNDKMSKIEIIKFINKLWGKYNDAVETSLINRGDFVSSSKYIVTNNVLISANLIENIKIEELSSAQYALTLTTVSKTKYVLNHSIPFNTCQNLYSKILNFLINDSRLILDLQGGENNGDNSL